MDTLSKKSAHEDALAASLQDLLATSPLPKTELSSNLGLYGTRQATSRLLFLHALYQRILSVHGSIFQFGVRWGQDLAWLTQLRGILEPYNYTRRLVGFDTFAGFSTLRPEDGNHAVIRAGAYGVTENYSDHLTQVLLQQDANNPLAHIPKFELVTGDASETLPEYLVNHPETVVALAYFDMDVYQPTVDCLKALLPYLQTGSILVFDELNHPEFPGETVAFREVFAGRQFQLERFPWMTYPSFIVLR